MANRETLIALVDELTSRSPDDAIATVISATMSLYLELEQLAPYSKMGPSDAATAFRAVVTVIAASAKLDEYNKLLGDLQLQVYAITPTQLE